ncbi:MAG: LOG family protein, partial [Polyangia bacterium]
HMARAIAVFPGGFGTLDEMSEILTLAQTHKLDRRIMVLLFGESYWKEIINFDALVRYGMINQSDLDLFRFADDPQTALRLLTEGLASEPQAPAFARSLTSRNASTWLYQRSGD